MCTDSIEEGSQFFNRIARFLIKSAVIFGAAWSSLSISSAEEYTLDYPLELRMDRAGFAGVSARIITIQPDGTWSEEHYLVVEPGEGLDRQKRTKHREGALRQEKLQELSTQLKKPELQLSPKTEKREGPISDEWQVTVSYGPDRVTLAPTQNDDGARVSSDPATELVEAIKLMVSQPDE